MIAGPSEIGILADETAKPQYLAIDLFITSWTRWNGKFNYDYNLWWGSKTYK